MDFYAPGCRPYNPLDNYEVLVAFVLYKERVLGMVDEICDALPSVQAAPDQFRAAVGFKVCPVPVCFKAKHNFLHFVWVIRNNGVVACFRKVFCFPVQGFNKGHFFIYDHRFFVSDDKIGACIAHFDASSNKPGP